MDELVYSRYLLYTRLDPYWDQSIVVVKVLKSLICLASQLCHQTANLNNQFESWELCFVSAVASTLVFLSYELFIGIPSLWTMATPSTCCPAYCRLLLDQRKLLPQHSNTDLQLLYVFRESFGFWHCVEDCRQTTTEHKLASLTPTFENFVN